MKILFVDLHEGTLYSFRKELLDELINQGHEVVLCVEARKRVLSDYANRIKVINIPANLKSKNIFSNISLKKKYKHIINSEKPELIISYTIKPNIYCGMYSKNTSIITNVTGLGNTFKEKSLLSKIAIHLYKKSFKNVDVVFFQNEDGLKFFKANNIPLNSCKVIPGSGVNTEKFIIKEIDCQNKTINFLYASRAIKEKGFNLLIEAIPSIVEKHKNVHFNFLTAEEDVLASKEARLFFTKYSEYVTILNRSEDMNSIYAQNDFTISPSYYREGISNVLLESLACGRPIITTNDNPGCMEVLQEGVDGYGIKSNDLTSLCDAIEKAINTPKDKIKEMGLKGREFVKKNYERKIVINDYLQTIDELSKK